MFLSVQSFSRAQAEPQSTAIIETAAEVLALSDEAAKSYLSVSLSGVITAAEQDWRGNFVVQDSSGGVFVESLGGQPEVGDRVEVKGVSSPGSYAPIVRNARWTKTGTSELPAARAVPIERLMAGMEDCQRIEVSGLIRSVSSANQKLRFDVSVGAYRIHVFPKLAAHLNARSLVGARVRVRGTTTTAFNSVRQHLTAINLFVPVAEDFVVEQPAAQPAFEQPTIAPGDVARYRPDASLGKRIRVKGTVTFQRIGLDFFIQDESGGLQIESPQATRLTSGESVEAAGFIEFINHRPVLKDAEFRELPGEAASNREATEVTPAELQDGLHQAKFIRLAGQLIERSTQPVRRENASFAGTRTICTIQTPGLIFTAESESAQAASPISSIPLGSTVELRGVAAIEIGGDGKLRSLNLLLPDPDGMHVVERPKWVFTERLLAGFAIIGGVLAAAVAWLLTVSRKNSMLAFLVAERERAQRELQQAHALLESRVKERTSQLRADMTVRKATELEFRAVLGERTRLAHELHDSLEQRLTGIALQLDTASKQFQRDPADAEQPTERARGLLHQSQVELRRSIRDLRSRELDQFDLAEALSLAARQITAGCPVTAEVETTGDRKRLSEIAEENLLRIAQEALTNVVKHSGATLVTLRLAYSAASVSLEIKDNGRGLTRSQIAEHNDQQFGLVGMIERARRLGGRLDVDSIPGEGTSIRVVISLGE